jgi:hypothetical protein
VCRGAACDLAEGRHPEADRGGPAGALIELCELVLGVREAGAQVLGLAEPAVLLGLGNAGGQVVADLGQAGSPGQVRAQERAPDAPLTELTPVFGQVAACFRVRLASLSA